MEIRGFLFKMALGNPPWGPGNVKKVEYSKIVEIELFNIASIEVMLLLHKRDL